jgi:hypothetical protein
MRPLSTYNPRAVAEDDLPYVIAFDNCSNGQILHEAVLITLGGHLIACGVCKPEPEMLRKFIGTRKVLEALMEDCPEGFVIWEHRYDDAMVVDAVRANQRFSRSFAKKRA